MICADPVRSRRGSTRSSLLSASLALAACALAGACSGESTAPAASGTRVADTAAPECDAVGFQLYAPSASTVWLSGDFLSPAWPASPQYGAIAMVRGDDGTWRTTTAIAPAGAHQYKFIVDGSTWLEDPTDTDRAPDGFGGYNSVLACVDPPPCETVAFRLNAPGAQTVWVTGTFATPVWGATPETGATTLMPGADGAFVASVRIRQHGRQEYKFIVDRYHWRADPANPAITPDGFGGYNSVLDVCPDLPPPPAPPPPAPPPVTRIDPRRSLVVTDQVILGGFSLERVLTQLAVTGALVGPNGDSRAAALELFHEMFRAEASPACEGGIDGFPLECGRAEAALANVDPFANVDGNPDAFVPLGLFNRFDLAPADASTCGEYRIVFGKRSGQTDGSNRVLLIFEGALPNPDASRGLEGCRSVEDVWAGLSTIADPNQRAALLEDFYFVGTPALGVEPVVTADHYGAHGAGSGQIRVNQFMQSPWTLRQFALERNQVGVFAIAPHFVATNPFGALFDPGSTDPRAASFQAFFVGQVATLIAGDRAVIFLADDPRFDAAESPSMGSDNDYPMFFRRGEGGNPFRAAIAGELARLGSPLTPDDVVARALTQSCAGCHQLGSGIDLGGGAFFGQSNGFVQVSEQGTETGPDGPRFLVSELIQDVLLPHRQAVLEAFLAGTPAN